MKVVFPKELPGEVVCLLLFPMGIAPVERGIV